MIIYSDHRMSYSMPDHWVLYVLVNLTHGRSIQEFPASLTRALHRLVALRTEQCTVLWCLQLPQQRRCSAWSEDEHELPSHMKPRIVMSFLLSNVDLLCPRLHEWMKWTRISVFAFWEHPRKQPRVAESFTRLLFFAHQRHSTSGNLQVTMSKRNN